MSAAELRELTGRGEAEQRIRNSRFLGIALPCRTAGEAQVHVRESRAAHPKATHHVWAWRILETRTGAVLQRSDDDGEPGGTAGRPTLQVLESQRVVNGLIVVVRYFGGIKLGAGGLVRAYATTASAALAAATLQTAERRVRLEVRFAFPCIASVESWVEREGLEIVARDFDPSPRFTLVVPLARRAPLEAALRELTGGRVEIEEQR